MDPKAGIVYSLCSLSVKEKTTSLPLVKGTPNGNGFNGFGNIVHPQYPGTTSQTGHVVETGAKKPLFNRLPGNRTDKRLARNPQYKG